MAMMAVARAAPGAAASLALANSTSSSRSQPECSISERPPRVCPCHLPPPASVSFPSRSSSSSSVVRRRGTAAVHVVRRLTCHASQQQQNNDSFDRRLNQMAEDAKKRAADAAKAFTAKAEEAVNDARRKASKFQDTNDLKGKAAKAARQANQRLEELGYDVRKQAVRWDRQYGFSDKAEQAKEFAQEQVHNLDKQLNLRQKLRNLQSEFRLRWPAIRRNVNSFLDTTLGKAVATLFFAWFVLSGWFFRLFFYSVWLLPLAAPLLIGTLSKNLIVEGSCPACGTRYVGSRNQIVVCQRCRGVVWQPRQDFSKDGRAADPTIIDIDLDQ